MKTKKPEAKQKVVSMVREKTAFGYTGVWDEKTQKMMGLIRKSPGLTTVELSKQLKLPEGEVVAVGWLPIVQGWARTRQAEGKPRRWYPTDLDLLS